MRYIVAALEAKGGQSEPELELPKVPSIDLGDFKIPKLEVEIWRDEWHGGWGFCVKVPGVTHVENGEPDTICSPYEHVTDYRQIGPAVRHLLIRLLTHELDEWLHVDGRRVNDPHPTRAVEPK